MENAFSKYVDILIFSLEVIAKVFCPKGAFHFSVGLSALWLDYYNKPSSERGLQ